MPARRRHRRDRVPTFDICDHSRGPVSESPPVAARAAALASAASRWSCAYSPPRSRALALGSLVHCVLLRVYMLAPTSRGTQQLQAAANKYKQRQASASM